MHQLHGIRADFDTATVVAHQAYAPAVADPGLAAGRLVPPFSFGRMTWIEPSFRRLVHRGNRARKPGRERVLATPSSGVRALGGSSTVHGRVKAPPG
ncbi:DUF4291 family protein [Kitasatospora sp. NPDC056783]|uniref:DUF4291 family protein n=1 Tax=Kitasatospora sp. NPDC056783 TaxID=3345943 RepID=UPI003689F033